VRLYRMRPMQLHIDRYALDGIINCALELGYEMSSENDDG